MIEFHGSAHFTTAKIFVVKLFWGLVIAAAIGGTVALSAVTLHRYLTNPTSVMINFENEVSSDIPDVLICSSQMLNLATANISDSLAHYLQQYFIFRTISNIGFQPFREFLNQYDHHANNEQLSLAMSNFNDFEQFLLHHGVNCEAFLLECVLDISRSFNCCAFAVALPHYQFGKCFVLRNLSSFAKQSTAGINGGLTVVVGSTDTNSSESATEHSLYLEVAKDFITPTTSRIPLVSYASNYVAMERTDVQLSSHRLNGCTPDSRISGKVCYLTAWAEAFETICNCSEVGFYTRNQILYNISRTKICTPFDCIDCFTQKRPKLLYDQLARDNCLRPSCNEMTYTLSLTTSSLSQSYSRMLMKEKDSSVRYTRIAVYYPTLGYRSFTEFQSMTFDSVLTAVGGSIGLFLGASIISVVQFGAATLVWLKQSFMKLMQLPST